MKKNRRLLSIYITAILVILLIQAVFLNYWYQKTLKDVGNQAVNISEVVARSIDIEAYKKIVTTKERDPYFNQMQSYFASIQEITAVKYVYVEHALTEYEIEYIFDSEKDSLGETDTNYTPEAHHRLDSFYTQLEDAGEWGILFTGYSPLIDSNGQLVGAVGTDVNASYFLSELLSRMWRTVLYSVAMIILFGLLIYLSLRQEIRERKQAEVQALNSMRSLQNLLDNAGQGFLSFGPNLAVYDIYSKECLRLFGIKPTAQRFPDLIFPSDAKQNQFLTSILTEILNEKDPVKKDVLLCLLPEDILLNGKHIQMEYKLIDSIQNRDSISFMVIMTDVTDKQMLQTQMDEKHVTLSMIVQAITHREDLLETVKDYQNFYVFDLKELLTSEEALDLVIPKIFHQVHTLKGCFSQLEMVHIAQYLHQFENDLTELSCMLPDLDRQTLQQTINQYNFVEVLDTDTNILRKTLGNEFFTKEKTIEKSKIRMLEENIFSIHSAKDYEFLHRCFQRIYNGPLKELFSSYPEYVSRLALRLGKYVDPFVIEGEDIQLDQDKYRPFIKSLIHLFHNAIDHGLEDPVLRKTLGKPELGCIRCHIAKDDQYLYIKISDDGQGIDWTAIREKVVTLQLVNSELAFSLKESELGRYIFTEGFSTQNYVTEVSGRGVGLAAVYQELLALNGTVTVHSLTGQGTEFVFTIPFIDEKQETYDSIHHILLPAITHIEREIAQLDLQDNFKSFYATQSNCLELHEISSFIFAQGSIRGIFVFSSDSSFIRNIIANMMSQTVPDETDSFEYEDYMAEYSNIVIGNCADEYSATGSLVRIEAPIAVQAQGAKIRYLQAEIATWNLQGEAGLLSLSFIPINYLE